MIDIIEALDARKITEQAIAKISTKTFEYEVSSVNDAIINSAESGRSEVSVEIDSNYVDAIISEFSNKGYTTNYIKNITNSTLYIKW